MGKNKLFVSVPSLAPLDEYTEILKKAWDSKVLTHNGPLLVKLEEEIVSLLKIHDCVNVTNGTVALQLAIRALNLKGEIITTPFTWIATASAIKYEGCVPVFVDINPVTFNIDPDLIESAITENTVAIMPVHVFSNTCEITKIEAIAKKHNLKVIYDAAHAFGVDYQGQSIMKYGDISCTSFHATKLFNTGEGGACFSQDDDIIAKLKELRFFGHNEDKSIVSDGCNGKMTEIHAALGLANLRYYDQVLQRRKEIFGQYYNGLCGFTQIRFQKFTEGSYNYSYMPIVFESEELALKVEKTLNENDIFPRRYFYPSLDTLDYFGIPNNCYKSQDIASRILCLPSHNWLTDSDMSKIIKMIEKTILGE